MATHDPTTGGWEHVDTTGEIDTCRLKVPGGWLYRVGMITWQTTQMGEQPDYKHEGWHPPVFVPDPEAI